MSSSTRLINLPRQLSLPDFTHFFNSFLLIEQIFQADYLTISLLGPQRILLIELIDKNTLLLLGKQINLLYHHPLSRFHQVFLDFRLSFLFVGLLAFYGQAEHFHGILQNFSFDINVQR